MLHNFNTKSQNLHWSDTKPQTLANVKLPADAVHIFPTKPLSTHKFYTMFIDLIFLLYDK